MKAFLQLKDATVKSVIVGAICGPTVVFLGFLLLAVLLQVLHFSFSFHDFYSGLSSRGHSTFIYLFFLTVLALGLAIGVPVSVHLSMLTPDRERLWRNAAFAGVVTSFIYVISQSVLFQAGLIPEFKGVKMQTGFGPNGDAFVAASPVFFVFGAVGFLTIRRMWNAKNSERPEDLSPLS